MRSHDDGALTHEIEDNPERSSADNPTSTAEGSEGKDWQLWPPSPKMQIVLIAMAFGAFNLILLAIWAIVMVYRF